MVREENNHLFKLIYSTDERIGVILNEIHRIDIKFAKDIKTGRTRIKSFELSVRDQIKAHKKHKKNKRNK